MESADIKSETKPIWNPLLHTDNSNMTMSNLDIDLEKPKGRHSENYLKSLVKNDNALENEIPATFAQFVQVWKTLRGYELKFNYLKRLRYDICIIEPKGGEISVGTCNIFFQTHLTGENLLYRNSFDVIRRTDRHMPGKSFDYG